MQDTFAELQKSIKFIKNEAYMGIAAWACAAAASYILIFFLYIQMDSRGSVTGGQIATFLIFGAAVFAVTWAMAIDYLRKLPLGTDIRELLCSINKGASLHMDYMRVLDHDMVYATMSDADIIMPELQRYLLQPAEVTTEMELAA